MSGQKVSGGRVSGGRHVLLSTDAVGGVWRYTMELAAGLAARGTRLTLAVLGPPPDTAQRREAAAIPLLTLRETGLPLDWTAPTPAALTAAAACLAALAREPGSGIGLAHLHAPALAAARWPVPVLAVAHSDVATWWQAVHGGALPPDLGWRAAATAAGLRDADAVLAPSAAYARALGAAYGIAPPAVVWNGADAAPAHPPSPRARHVLAAGRVWDEGKNIATLAAAARRGGVALLVAGALTGPHGAEAALGEAAEGEAAGGLVLLGPLPAPALRAAYARCGVFASAALYEPFGLAPLEAAQAGAALVLSDIPTHRELWADAALFVPPRDAEGFARAFASLLDAPGEAARLGARAARRARRYGRARMVAAIAARHDALDLEAVR